VVEIIKYIKSPINYSGSKYRLLKKILPLFPSNINTFVDLFCGACNVAINIDANRIICNDLIHYLPELFNVWKNKSLDEINNYIDYTIKENKLSATVHPFTNPYFRQQFEILPYTNYKDVNNNKLYWGDILVDNNQNYYMIIYHEKLQFIAIDLKYKFNVDNTNYKMLYAEIYYKRIGSIYELPAIQKQFNIEV